MDKVSLKLIKIVEHFAMRESVDTKAQLEDGEHTFLMDGNVRSLSLCVGTDYTAA